MKNLIYLFLFCSILSGCSKNEEEIPAAPGFNTDNLLQLIHDASSGNKTANDTLSGFFDLTIPFTGSSNNIIIDSISTSSGKTYYCVLFEHSNPIYNRFAIYDSVLNLYLIDKSLNGNISLSKNFSLANPLFSLSESFVSKDTLMLERLSLYQVDDSSAALCFRTFTKFNKPGIEFVQEITELSDERVKTAINSSRNSPINKKADVFLYDESRKIYLSEQDVFSNFVIDEVQNFESKSEKPQITDEQSAIESAGILPANNANGTVESIFGAESYSLTLDEYWKELKDIAVTVYLNQNLRGTRYLNNTAGASIYVISIPVNDHAEMYIDYTLDKVTEGIYKVRYSDKIEIGKNFTRFFEYSCKERKFILIFETSKYTYEKHKEMYENIINTFYMDC